MFTSWRMFALDFETSNYYSKNYLFDAQIYSVNTFVSENTLSHQLGNFTPHLDYVQYQGDTPYLLQLKQVQRRFTTRFLDSTTLQLQFGAGTSADTDGVNFSCPEDDDRKYVGKGLHRFVKKDVVYEGIDADVAEYNERYMFGAMGLDIDDIMDATINLSRKNYAILKPGGKVKLTGNTIKGKTIPKYIEKFLAKAIRMLLDGKGKEFVDYYYGYLEKIYNKQVPLVEIANKSKVKKTIESYRKRGTDKNGRDLPRQAHMELVIRDSVHVSLGDTLYYVNNGTRKSHGDISFSKTKKDPEGTLKFNCYLITEDQIKKNPDLTGEYNVPKYIDAFNKKVEPLLVVFPLHVRESLIIDNPELKQFYTSKELELIGGIATNPEDQDTLEELMTMSDGEIEFWRQKGLSSEYMIKDRFVESKESIGLKRQIG